MLIKRIYHTLRSALLAFKYSVYISNIRNGSTFKHERVKAETQRAVHQIEKGLSIADPKEGFGYAKIEKIMDYMSQMNFGQEKRY